MGKAEDEERVVEPMMLKVVKKALNVDGESGSAELVTMIGADDISEGEGGVVNGGIGASSKLSMVD